MKKSQNTLPDRINVWDIFQIKIPLFQLPIGTLVLVYQIEENGMYCLAENMFTFYVGFTGSEWGSLQFLQRSGITCNYLEQEFKSDLQTAYFKLLFIKFKRLESLN